MLKHLSVLTAAILLSGTSSVFAASTTDLTVTGLITPAACTPGLANNGNIDYGKIAAKDLNQTQMTSLGRTPLQVNVACDAATRFALHLVDNRTSSSLFPGIMYGLGMTNSSEKIGVFEWTYSNAVTENGATSMVASYDQGTTWQEHDEGDGTPPTVWTAAGDKSTGSWLPVATKNLTMNMIVGAYIARADSLTLTDEVLIDGSATLEVKYL